MKRFFRTFCIVTIVAGLLFVWLMIGVGFGWLIGASIGMSGPASTRAIQTDDCANGVNSEGITTICIRGGR